MPSRPKTFSEDSLWERLQKIDYPQQRLREYLGELNKLPHDVLRKKYTMSFARLLCRKLEDIDIADPAQFARWSIWVQVLKETDEARGLDRDNAKIFLLSLQNRLLRARNERIRSQQPKFDEWRFVLELQNLDPTEKAEQLAKIDAEEQEAKDQPQIRVPVKRRWEARDRSCSSLIWPTDWFEPKTTEQICHALGVGRSTIGGLLKKLGSINPGRPANQQAFFSAEASRAALLEWFKRPRWYGDRERRRVYLLRTIHECACHDAVNLANLLQVLKPAIRSVRSDFENIDDRIEKVIQLAQPRAPKVRSYIGEIFSRSPSPLLQAVLDSER